MNFAAAIILFCIVLAGDIYFDIRKKKKGKPVRHTYEAWIRAGLLVPVALLLSGFYWDGGIRVDGSFLYVALRMLATAFMMFSVWWLLFDAILNKLQGHPLWFNGSEDPDDAKLDNFLQRLEDWQEAVLKVGFVFLSIILYVKSL